MGNLSEVGNLLFALEEKLVQSATHREADALSLFLADDFREFGSSGRVYTKRAIIDLIAIEALREVSLYDFACTHLSPATALVTYRSRSGTGEALRSSLWIYQDDRWLMLFHQGTKVPPDETVQAVS